MRNFPHRCGTFRVKNAKFRRFFAEIDGYGACSTPVVPMSRPKSDVAPTLTAEDARVQLLEEITRKINLGASLEDTFNLIYERLQPFVPYNRIAVALADEAQERLFIIAAKSDGKV